MTQPTTELTPPDPQQPSQFALLKQRRYAPYFITQLLGAFNDNVYKNALVALIAFAAVRSSTVNDGLLINLAAGLFILPFFLFSAPVSYTHLTLPTKA